jgi:hypothetical protein
MKTKFTNVLRSSLYIAILAAPLFLAGCVSSSKVNNAPTQGVGQQLLDLEKAYKEGIITEDQYNKMKKEIINRNS